MCLHHSEITDLFGMTYPVEDYSYNVLTPQSITDLIGVKYPVEDYSYNVLAPQ